MFISSDELVDLRASVNPADTNQSDERIESERTLRVAAESQVRIGEGWVKHSFFYKNVFVSCLL